MNGEMKTQAPGHRRIKPPGDVMLDRSLLTLGSAFGLAVLHALIGMNVFLRPKLSIISLGFGLALLCAFWLRAAAAVYRGWSGPSARVVRFVSIGALLLMFWPVIMILIVTLMPPD